MIVNSIMNYIGELQQIEARALRDKYGISLFVKYTGPENSMVWLENTYNKFIKSEKIQGMFNDNDLYGQPRDVRESEDGEVILFDSPRRGRLHFELCYPEISLIKDEERVEEYARNIYALCWNMGWLDEINELIINDAERKEFRRIHEARAITKSLRHEVFKRDNYRCLECGATNKETILHIDHIVPVSLGGSKDIDNLQTLCKKCNLSKGNGTWVGGVK